MYSPPRKRRYPVNWPLQYRRINDVEWRPGRTINMSVSGILFEAQEPLKHDEAVELLIGLIENRPDLSMHRMLPTRLVVRGSCSPVGKPT